MIHAVECKPGEITMAKKKTTTSAKTGSRAGKAGKPVRLQLSKLPSKRVGSAKGKPHTIYHKDGSIYAKGQLLDGKMHGYWEFFRKNGTIMRSGSFDRDEQIGTWTTYDASGKPYKVTEMKAGAKAQPSSTMAKPTIATTPKTPARKAAAKPKLLSGGNPQIAKGYGDAPVQAYIAAMPGWKSEFGRRLDAIIIRTVPKVRKAVKWNSPFYGVDEGVWFLSFHCFTKYIKVAFFRGSSLRPVPPGESKQQEVRYLDIRENDEFDEAQFAAWVKQASQLPGERV